MAKMEYTFRGSPLIFYNLVINKIYFFYFTNNKADKLFKYLNIIYIQNINKLNYAQIL